MRTVTSLVLATSLSLVACQQAGPGESDYSEIGEGGGGGGGKTDDPGVTKKKMDRMVAMLKGGDEILDMPLIARDYELPFKDATWRTVKVVDCKDGLAPIVNPKMIEIIKDFSGDDDAKGSPAVLQEGGVMYAIQNFGARTYLAKTMIDRRARKEFEGLLEYADEVMRIGVYDNGSELTGTEYFAIEFRDLEKAVIFQMDYSEVY